MRTRLIIVPVLFHLILSCQVFSQQSINQSDKYGGKTGLWIQNNGLVEVYYKDDRLDGIYKSYYQLNGKLEVFGQFTYDVKSGEWFYFDESSHLIFKESDIKNNVQESVVRGDVEMIRTHKYSSFIQFYYPDGSIKEEGRVFYDEDIEIDFTKTGTWTYYNLDGEVIKVEEN